MFFVCFPWFAEIKILKNLRYLFLFERNVIFWFSDFVNSVCLIEHLFYLSNSEKYTEFLRRDKIFTFDLLVSLKSRQYPTESELAKSGARIWVRILFPDPICTLQSVCWKKLKPIVTVQCTVHQNVSYRCRFWHCSILEQFHLNTSKCCQI